MLIVRGMVELVVDKVVIDYGNVLWCMIDSVGKLILIRFDIGSC